MTSVERKTALVAVLNQVIKSQLNGDKNHGWGADDSMAVIDAVVAKDAELSPKGTLAEKYTLSDEALDLVRAVVNPSAFRQILEAKKLLNPPKKGESTRGSVKDLISA